MLELSSLIEERTELKDEEELGRQDERLGENREERSQVRGPRKSPMELLVMCAPMVHVSCLLYPGFYFLSLDMPILLISTFPEESRNVYTISFCLAWDTYIITFVLAWGTYIVFAVTSFVLTFKDTVDLVMRKIR